MKSTNNQWRAIFGLSPEFYQCKESGVILEKEVWLNGGFDLSSLDLVEGV